MMSNFTTRKVMGAWCAAAALAGAVPQALGADYEPYRANEFLKLQVATNDDQKIGKVEDYAADLDRGRIVYVVLKKGNEWTAVPFAAFKFRDGNQLLLDTTMSRFNNAPRFDPKQWSTIGDLRWGEVVHRHYGLADRWDDSAANPDPVPLVQGSKLLDLQIENTQERDLGEINDFVFNARDGKFTYAVLEPDSALNLGNNKMLPVPWEALTIKGEGRDIDDRRLVLNKGVGELSSAPTFNRNDWPRLTDRQWNKQVTDFYGVSPDWLSGTSESDKPDKSESSKHDLTGWQADGQYVKLFDPDTVETLRGTIVDYDQFKTRPDGAPGILMVMRADDGREHVVHLGPKWFVDERGIKLDKGKEVRVTGSRIQYEGDLVIIASEVRQGDKTVTIRNDKGVPRWVND